MNVSLEEILRERPVDRANVDAQKEMMLAAIRSFLPQAPR